MWYFSGFNGFGQFGKAHVSRVLRVTNFQPDLPAGDFLIQPAWSCNVIAINNEIFLSGFVHESQKTTDKLSFPGQIIDICTNDKYCLILLNSGQLFKLTKSDLNIQEVRFADVEIVAKRKRRIFEATGGEVKPSGSPKIRHIACGSNLAVAISCNNAVYNIPTKIFQFAVQEKIVSLQCGFEHAIALNSNGDVHSWGNGLRGQLGIDDMRVQETPMLVEALGGIKIVSIAAGGWHSAAISSFGDVYTWGFNCNGQLGIRVFKISGVKNPTVYPLPQVIDLPRCCKCPTVNVGDDSCEAIAVYCGARHTIVQTTCGSIFAAGWNAYGQLALPNDGNMMDEFKKICDLPEGQVSVICGPWSTVFKVK